MTIHLDIRRVISTVLILAFSAFTFGPFPLAQAQEFRLPMAGVMVHLSPPLAPPILKGIKIHPDNPFRFDFILDKGEVNLSNEQLKAESSKLVKYFLASLTIPEKDMWVNLSPYEKDRIITQSFGLTEMGRDLLAEDYMLKQITASLIYPEDAVGKKFWKRVYEEASQRFGTTNIPVNTFNKVWIVPEKAVVYENAKAGTAYVVDSKLKVMLEEDYLSLRKHAGARDDVASVGANIVREIVIPELTREVNENKNFSRLRQVFNSLILATWYKKKIKDSILLLVYSDKNKVAGVNINDPQEKEKIYLQYLKAFKKGVYNFIKEEQDPMTQEMVPRKYFSGGVKFGDMAMNVTDHPPVLNDRAQLMIVGVNAQPFNSADPAMQQVQESAGLLPVTDVEHHDPQHFVYTIKVSGLSRLLKPDQHSGANLYYSFSLISQDHLATYEDTPFGLVMDFPETKVFAVLRQMHADIATHHRKDFPGLLDFLTEHRKKDPTNILYEAGLPGNKGRHLDEGDIFSSPPRNADEEYKNNTEIVVLNTPELKAKSVILIVSTRNPMSRILRTLNSQQPDAVAVRDAIIKDNMPVVITGEQGTDLQAAKEAFLREFPNEIEVSENRFAAKSQEFVNSGKADKDRAMLREYIEDTLVMAKVENHIPVLNYTFDEERGIFLKYLVAIGRNYTEVTQDILPTIVQREGKWSEDTIFIGPSDLKLTESQEIKFRDIIKFPLGEEGLLGTFGALGKYQRKHLAVLFSDHTDDLTKMLNWKAVRVVLHQILGRIPENGRIHLRFANLDLDSLKAVSSLWGQDVTRKVVEDVADAVKESIRDVDVAFHLHGGDEFAILMPVLDEPRNYPEILRKAIRNKIYSSLGFTGKEVIEALSQEFPENVEPVVYEGLLFQISLQHSNLKKTDMVRIKARFKTLKLLVKELRDNPKSPYKINGWFLTPTMGVVNFDARKTSDFHEKKASDGLLKRSDTFLRIAKLQGKNTIKEGPFEDEAMRAVPKTIPAVAVKKDAAMSYGGIDLAPANNVLKTQNNGGEIIFHMDPSMLKQLQNATGFVPVIINFQPMNNLRAFLGY